MKLFLAAIVANTIDQLIEVLPDIPQNLMVAFIPTAADVYNDKSFVVQDRDKLKQAGFIIKNVDIKEKREDDLKRELESVDIIFVAGGNTFYLLEKAIESGFDKIVKELIKSDKIYVGSSAGAVLVCPTIEFVKTMDDPNKAPNLKSFEGLNLIDFLILPHCEGKYKESCELLAKEYMPRYKVITLTNNQAIVVEDEEYKIV